VAVLEILESKQVKNPKDVICQMDRSIPHANTSITVLIVWRVDIDELRLGNILA
jgi:hypothetical protein